MSDQSILHYLTRIGVTDDGHVSGGMTYLDWKEAYYAMSGAKTSRLTDKAGKQGMEDKGSKYLILVRLLGQMNQKTLEQAMDIRPVTPAMYADIYLARHRFIKVFDLVGSLISQTNDRVKQTACAHEQSGLDS